LCGIASHVAEEDSGIGKQLPELAVRHKEGTKSTQAIERLIAVLAGCVLVNRRLGSASGAAAEVLGLPDEVLEEVALVLGEEQNLGLLNDVLQVRNQLLALTRQLLRRRVERLVCD
jgi:hypothetical protein